ncbi:MAG: HDOD domain-containing protein [Rubinisphaera brasiliensis]|uniref:Signal transduction protein n=1 Tax=Rubinisphaera brasiliensis (strain ATCC 49424 / DSM 5305 / JCM 21570 / IAM 15109 / NBRC 103401 / IFAM 1448) TaxID=756272 RepID=F0SJT2_RUBBR|nr:HDOD domain-containing protein [Rubinisphaera brasiliensis]ADY61920.1 putative signal transduction protein [Rubinisphaera brasiliensis DSM 5305]MBB01372.1 HDOD domain-containing protein [Planctomyces sp.]
METTSQDAFWANLVAEKLSGLSIKALPPTLKLPALPLAVTQFLERSKQPNTTLKELSAIIETDSGLTLELLRFVNSSFVGLRHKATSVTHALTLLGQRQSTTFLITTGMEAAVRARKSKLINQACFWNSCMQKALFAREVAKLLQADADMAFAGAMLQDFLLPVLTNDLFDTYLKFVEQRNEQARLLTEYERAQFGWDHALAAACLARRWYLPDELVGCIMLHHHGLHLLADSQTRKTSAAAVAISALLPDQLRQNFSGLEQLLLLEQKWPAFDLDQVVERVDEIHAEMDLGVRNDFPLARRCKPALDRHREISDGMLNTEAIPA